MWISQWKNTGSVSKGQHGGHSYQKLTETVENSLWQYVKEHQLSTLLEMQKFVLKHHQIQVSLTTISTFLKKKKITLKIVRDVIANRNSEVTKQKRFVYASRILEGDVDLHKCIFIDEAGFNH